MSLIQTQIFLCFEFYTDSKKCKNEPYKQVKQEKQAQSYPPNTVCSRFENPNTQNRKKDKYKNKHVLKTSTRF